MAEFSRKHRSPVQSTDTGRKLYATRSLIRYGPQRVENILEEKVSDCYEPVDWPTLREKKSESELCRVWSRKIERPLPARLKAWI